ncbi:PalH/RIM21-domain-containing protein [Dipodascopsis uninucleata]
MWRSPTTTSTHSQCTPYTLPAGYIAVESSTATFTTTALFTPLCSGMPLSSSSSSSNDDVVVQTSSMQDPFYSSIIPITFTVSGTTVLAWVLFLLLLVTPQKRPVLQKIGVLTVSISLSIALGHSTNILRNQYEQGYDDVNELRNYLEDGVTLQIFRVISDIFIGLAQVQTLMRLFPRHREKAIIKYLGVVLIVIDSIFWSLKSFLSTRTGDTSFRDAVPALAYLFQIILALLYAAFVIYYSVSKREFAYHKRNFILAMISVAAVLTPLIFFLLDISKPNLTGWGDFVRWVGTAAATVVVWEWVERTEYLESKDQETGVLGRQIFEDEMLETGTSRGSRAHRHRGDHDSDRRRRRRERHRHGHQYRHNSQHIHHEQDEQNDIESCRGQGDDSSVVRISSTSDSHNSHRSSMEASYDDDNAQQSSGNSNYESALNEVERKEGSRVSTSRLSRRSISTESSSSSHSIGNHNNAHGQGNMTGRFHGLMEAASKFLFFFGRPISRATTGTSATTYQINNPSVIDDSGEERVRHVYPLKRGLSRSTESSSPASFVTSSNRMWDATAIQRPSLVASRSSQHQPSPVGTATSQPAVSHAGSPVPSVSFADDIRRSQPTQNSTSHGSPLARVSELSADGAHQGWHHGRLDNDSNSVGENENYGSSNDLSDDDGFDDSGTDTEFVVQHSNQPGDLVIDSALNMTPDDNADQPPAFQPIPGYNPGDYWDEKAQSNYAIESSAANTDITTTSTNYQPASTSGHTAGVSSANPTGRSRARLEPFDSNMSRRVLQHITGIRDWVITVEDHVNNSTGTDNNYDRSHSDTG